LIYSIIINLKVDYISISINNYQQIVASYRGYTFSPIGTPLVATQWTQILASFGHIQQKPNGPIETIAYILVNNHGLNANMPPGPPFPSNTATEITIGSTDSESFKGSIGLVEIYTPGAIFQESKYHLIIYFLFLLKKRTHA